jgi:hypothetical protein
LFQRGSLELKREFLGFGFVILSDLVEDEVFGLFEGQFVLEFSVLFGYVEYLLEILFRDASVLIHLFQLSDFKLIVQKQLLEGGLDLFESFIELLFACFDLV